LPGPEGEGCFAELFRMSPVSTVLACAASRLRIKKCQPVMIACVRQANAGMSFFSRSRANP
jgi:hypothetical protein